MLYELARKSEYQLAKIIIKAANEKRSISLLNLEKLRSDYVDTLIYDLVFDEVFQQRISINFLYELLDSIDEIPFIILIGKQVYLLEEGLERVQHYL